MFSWELCEISKNEFSYRAHPVATSAFSRGDNLFSFLYTLIWFELKYIAKCLCEYLNVIFRLNWLVGYSFPPAMCSAYMYYQSLNQALPIVPSSKKYFHRETTLWKNLWVGGGG